jgi:hypothetical protein
MGDGVSSCELSLRDGDVASGMLSRATQQPPKRIKQSERSDTGHIE